MTYLRIRLNKQQPRQPKINNNELLIGTFVVRWNNGAWKLWNWREGVYQIGTFHTKAEAAEVARLGV